MRMHSLVFQSLTPPSLWWSWSSMTFVSIYKMHRYLTEYLLYPCFKSEPSSSSTSYSSSVISGYWLKFFLLTLTRQEWQASCFSQIPNTDKSLMFVSFRVSNRLAPSFAVISYLFFSPSAWTQNLTLNDQFVNLLIFYYGFGFPNKLKIGLELNLQIIFWLVVVSLKSCFMFFYKYNEFDLSE